MQLYLKSQQICYKGTETQPEKIFWELPKEWNAFSKTPLKESAFTKVPGHI